MKLFALVTLIILSSLACGMQVPTLTPQDVTIVQTVNTELHINTPVYGTVTAERLEVRAGAGTQFANVGYLYQGDRIELLGNLDPATPKCGAGWLQIVDGYVCKEFVK